MTMRTRSVAAGFDRHGIPPSASNDTGTALCFPNVQTTWAYDLDLWGRGAFGWCGSSSSIRIPSLKFVGLAIRKIWRTMCVSINGPGHPDLWPFDLKLICESHLRWGTFLPNLGTLGLWVLELFAMYATEGRTDRRTDGQKQRLLQSSLRGWGIIMWIIKSLSW